MRRVLVLFTILTAVALFGAAAGAEERPGTSSSRPSGGGSTQGPESPRLTARGLSPAQSISVAKSPTSRLAETDRSLLELESGEPINVIAKLDYDSVATYAGGIRGLGPTSPEATGRSLDANRGAVDRYLGLSGTSRPTSGVRSSGRCPRPGSPGRSASPMAGLPCGCRPTA